MSSPNPPTNIGKRPVLSMPPDKKKVRGVIIDEICQIQSNCPDKAIYLQKIEFDSGNKIEFRFTYYIIGKKPKRKGKWVFGQYSSLIPPKDLKIIIDKAIKKGWI